MKKCIILSLFAIGAGFANAQCPTGPVVLSTQAQVDAFPITYPACSYLNVRFEVKGPGITDLTPLSQLTGSSKNFYVNFNPDLTSLNGLQNITEILGDLTIEANPGLTNLHGLEGLVHVDNLMKVQNNTGLLTLEGLTAGGVFTNLGSVVVIENTNLTSMSDVYDNLQTVDEYILFNKNNSLTTINTFNNLTSIGWYLSVEDDASLVTLDAFHSLTQVGLVGATWNFDINKHPQLTTLNDFFNLSLLGKNFSISNNTALTQLSFPALTSIAGSMTIAANTSLTSLLGLGDFTLNGPLSIVGNTSLPECEALGICDYLGIVPPKSASISGNAVGCNTRAQVEAACAAAPVELVSFTGKADGGEVLLNWQTASEKDNDYFQIEHSTDGSAFEPVGKVTGKGTTASPSNYSFRHSRPSNGVNYYRFKQVDFDGKYAYSPIVSVEIARGLDVELYPNPTTGYVKLKGDLTEGTARLTDVTGRLISENQLPDHYLIDLTREPEGVYLLEIQVDNEKIVKRIVKQ